MYSIKEIFYTLQGEGAMSGRASVFCRFSGCNLWDGREISRNQAVCKFCDTDFVGTDGKNGGKYTHDELAALIYTLWQEKQHIEIFNNNQQTKQSKENNLPLNIMQGKPYVVLTGGEPMLQVDQKLLDALHNFNFEIAIETNGSKEILDDIDWVCVSPKFGSNLMVMKGNELKVVFPQAFSLEDMNFLSTLNFQHFFIQAKDDKHNAILAKQNLQTALHFCQNYPQWRLSVQTHKYINIP
jgi:7-carboxy-7-deazaguanine synthase